LLLIYCVAGWYNVTTQTSLNRFAWWRVTLIRVCDGYRELRVTFPIPHTREFNLRR